MHAKVLCFLLVVVSASAATLPQLDTATVSGSDRLIFLSGVPKIRCVILHNLYRDNLYICRLNRKMRIVSRRTRPTKSLAQPDISSYT